MIIYQTLIRLIFPLIIIYLAIYSKNIKQGKKTFLLQRLGFGYQNSHKSSSKPIWIHCASVGEVKAAEPIIKLLDKTQSLLITTNTPTGKELVDSLALQNSTHQYCPYDLPWLINKLIKQFQPQQLWVIETEIWPNLYQQCNQQNIPISLINARLSKKTLNAPNWLKDAYRQALKNVTQILCRSDAELARFKQLGVADEKLQTLGNLKYASLPNITQQPAIQLPTIGQPFVLLASSHQGEEINIVERWLKLERQELLVIVPRHPKRRNKILKSLEKHRAIIAVHSLSEKITDRTKIVIIDEIGKLMPLYLNAKLVIMGGSFLSKGGHSKGGHNVLEPASVKATILTGPDMSDFEAETRLLKQQQAIIQVQNYQELFQFIPALLADPELRQQMGNRAEKVIKSQQYILNDYLNLLC
jgi:3-deoxy-D-manno-octulosonic-acid transferase